MPRHKSATPLRINLTPLVAFVFAAGAATIARAGDEPPADLAKLEAQLKAAQESKDHSKALEIAESMHELLEPKHIETLYNIACLHCLLGDKDQAYAWLQKALDAGYWDFRHAMQDDDLGAIRGEERFRTMIRAAWVKSYIAMLEREERAEFQKPEEVMAALALKAGERVADIGAGSGYFTIPVAKAVGPAGVVWAIDIRQEMLDYIENRLRQEKLENVRLALVPKDDPQLPPAGVDTILMIDTLHYIQERTEYVKKLRAGLAPGGRVIIIDYRPRPWEERPWGPPPEQQIPRETIDADFAEAGLKPLKVHDFLPEQYFVEYTAK